MKQAFRPEWHWGRETERIVKELCIGRTLNFPCGMSQLGDVRADKDLSVRPDIQTDIRAPEFRFKKGEFETVICDPPFSFWALDKIYSWVHGIHDLATKRLIYRAPLVNLKPPKHWDREYMIIVDPACLTLNMLHIFTNPNQALTVGE